jgi:hypothetical protein
LRISARQPHWRNRQPSEAIMVEVSLFRLYLLRAMYVVIVVGFCFFLLPGILHPRHAWELMQGVVNCMLVAFWILALFGLRYPLQMLPVLLWEFLWKTMWLLVVGLPAWRSGQMDEATQANAFACIFVLLIPLVLPWRYLLAHYLLKAGDPWRARVAADPAQRPLPGASMR